MAFLLQDGNQLFTGALVLMLMIAMLEGVMILIGVGLSEVLDNLLPDMDIDLDAPDAEPGGVLTKLLGWLRFGEVPALILLVAFLVAFGITGLLIQMVVASFIGSLLPSWLLVLPVLLLALPQVRFVGNVLRRFAVGDETEAVGRKTFIGRVATITIGQATTGSPAEARFSDEFGTTHYVMVEPDAHETFGQGEQVLLVEERGASFRVIRPTSKHLMEQN
ncbi:Inner membrane protein YqiJ [Microbulbifer aggregans]|uniref:Inner membrane protein YqiJ n=1 Tax=Microbulbifer aggregans TaxID=1769779 RepID=A0A1C9W5N1_9GAMM|nr:YqiJ family protein [Microbulbifer aggregans]AOS96469.1 Inner membrane protein YqiJ [Microbulbifer aggregans]